MDTILFYMHIEKTLTAKDNHIRAIKIIEFPGKNNFEWRRVSEEKEKWLETCTIAYDVLMNSCYFLVKVCNKFKLPAELK